MRTGLRSGVPRVDHDQDRPDLDDVSLIRSEFADDPRDGTRQLDHRLVRLDVGNDLVAGHFLARPDMPHHDLGLTQAFPDVREPELEGAHDAWTTFRAARTTRSREGM